MRKILVSSIALSFSLGMPLAALADSYDNFIRKQVAEFSNSNDDKCKERKMEGGVESGSKITYYLCVYKNKPVYLRTVADDAPIGVSSFFNGGKLVQLSFAEAMGGVGFRNGQPVVEWNSEFSKRRVNWNLNAEKKARFLKEAAKETRILRKFGY
jgi:hypothetical protein